jgi:hypothetical protein
MKKKGIRLSAALLVFVMLSMMIIPGASADREVKTKPDGYIGAMRVVWCKEWISLREEPKKTSAKIAEIPLGAIVYSCVDIGNSLFYQCEYEGQTGYALIGYLWPAPECEPPLSSSITKKMTMDEVVGNGEVILDWQDYNMSVVAAHEWITEDNKKWEVLRIGCFINDSPIWGHEERAEEFGQYDQLKAFIGGVQDDWQIMVYNGAYGLSLLDLLSGKERWCVTAGNCPMGNAGAVAVDENGTVYVAGTDGPDPVAVSMEGSVLWKSAVNNPEIYGPYEIIPEGNQIHVKYESGMADGYKLATFDANGLLLSVHTEETGK